MADGVDTVESVEKPMANPYATPEQVKIAHKAVEAQKARERALAFQVEQEKRMREKLNIWKKEINPSGQEIPASTSTNTSEDVGVT